LFVHVYSTRAKPAVMRASNLLCQDLAVWGCAPPGANTRPTRRRLSEEGLDESLQGELQDNDSIARQAAFAFVQSLRGADSSTGVEGRRLNPAAASMAFVQTLNRTTNPQTGRPQGCADIIDICAAPPTFNPNTACVCSGQWDYAAVITTPPPIFTTLPPNFYNPQNYPQNSPQSSPQNFPQQNFPPQNFPPQNFPPQNFPQQNPNAQNIPQQTLPSPFVPQPSPSTQNVPQQNLPQNSQPQNAPTQGRLLAETGRVETAARKLEVSSPGPWAGSMGAFCDAWGDDQYIHGPWCFVSPYQNCCQECKSGWESSRGYNFVRSTAPCSDQVESRSQLVLDGLDSMAAPLKSMLYLGAGLILLSGLGYFLSVRPSRETVWVRLKTTDDGDEHLQYDGNKAGAERGSALEQRFQEAQAEAVEKLSKQTPDDLRLMLYGFYKQATDGDVFGERPGFFNSKERSKYDAWAAHKGMSRQDAIEGYIKVVRLL
jgi:diazepam-binding inhibitor (GABA receptor modulator, acyl-CoA-binding protein)